MNLFGFVLKDIMALLYGSGSYGMTGGLGLTDIFMFVATVMIFVSLAMMTINRSFSLIFHLPNECISWAGENLRGVGGGEAATGEKKIMAIGGAVKQGMGDKVESIEDKIGVGAANKKKRKKKEEI